jgi:hypothetical protein
MHIYDHMKHYGRYTIVSHALNTSALRPYVYLMKHTCYWSQRRDIQPSVKQKTSKVTCKTFSQLQYIEQVEIAVKLLTDK